MWKLKRYNNVENTINTTGISHSQISIFEIPHKVTFIGQIS